MQNDKRHELVFLRRHWITMVVFVLLGAGAGWTVSQFSSPVYKSQSSVYFFLDSSVSATDLNQGSTYTKNQMVSFAKLATAPIVLDSVVRDLSLDTTSRVLANSIDVSFAPDSLILQIVAGDESAARARDIANGVAQKLSVVVEQIGPNAVAGKGRISAQIIEQATAGSNPVSPDERANMATGAFLGLLLGFLIGLLREKVRWRVRSTGDLEAAGPGAVLGVVEPSRAGVPLMEAEPSGRTADQYRRAAMQLQQLHGTARPLALVVAAVSSQSSNSSVADNLAAAFAEQDAQVIVVRTNPGQGATDGRGLSDVLDGDFVLEEAVIPAADGTYDRLMSGKPEVNRHRQLASKGFDSLIARLQSLYDVVLVEAVPLGEAADALQIARRLDGLVLTVEDGTTRRRDVQARLEEVRATGVQLSGVLYCLRKRGSKYRAARTPEPVSAPATTAPRHELV
jgi:capsular polysaccharide biosynthesis protein